MASTTPSKYVMPTGPSFSSPKPLMPCISTTGYGAPSGAGAGAGAGGVAGLGEGEGDGPAVEVPAVGAPGSGAPASLPHANSPASTKHAAGEKLSDAGEKLKN